MRYEYDEVMDVLTARMVDPATYRDRFFRDVHVNPALIAAVDRRGVLLGFTVLKASENYEQPFIRAKLGGWVEPVPLAVAALALGRSPVELRRLVDDLRAGRVIGAEEADGVWYTSITVLEEHLARQT